MLLSVFIGAGVQIFVTVYTLIAVSIFDLALEFNKGILIGLGTGIFPFFGIVNGYVAGRFYTFFNGSSWKSLALGTAFFLPTLISGTFIIIEFCEYIDTEMFDSLPFLELILLMAFLYCIHVPFTIFGTFVGCL